MSKPNICGKCLTPKSNRLLTLETWGSENNCGITYSSHKFNLVCLICEADDLIESEFIEGMFICKEDDNFKPMIDKPLLPHQNPLNMGIKRDIERQEQYAKEDAHVYASIITMVAVALLSVILILCQGLGQTK